MHWDTTRGEGIGSGTGQITCDANGIGTLTYTRHATYPTLKWTVGDGSATDVVGHPVIVHGLNDSAANSAMRLSCGVIMKS